MKLAYSHRNVGEPDNYRTRTAQLPKMIGEKLFAENTEEPCLLDIWLLRFSSYWDNKMSPIWS
jgi:hypothetical protein